MNWKWQKIVFWLIAEIILNFVGYDQIADYSEFVSSQSSITEDRISETFREILPYSSLDLPDRRLISKK
jgi:hypothetical protein